MNIGLIGTPGSGKSELAVRLAEALDGNVEIVDGYIPEVAERVQIAMGPIAGYLGNFYAALERYGCERLLRLREDVDTVITCGTLIENAIYLAMNFSALADTMPEETRASAVPQVDASLRMMALLYNDIFTYDHAFYLPVREVTEDAVYMDTQLQAALASFHLIPVTLLDSEDQLDQAVAAIK